MLSKEDAQELKRLFKQIKPGKVGAFAYLEADANGEPLLLIHKKRVPPSEVKAARATAKKKKLCQGTVELATDPENFGEATNAKAFIFRTDKASSKFKRHLVTYFGKAVPKLKKSVVVVDDDSGEQAMDDREAFVASSAESAAEKTKLESKKAELQAKITAQLAKADTLDAEAKEMRGTWYRLKSTCDQKQAEADKVRREIERMQAEMASLSAHIDKVAKEIEEVPEDAAASLVEDMETSQASLDLLETQAQDAEDDEAQKLAELSLLMAEAAAMEKKVRAKELQAKAAREEAENMQGSLFTFSSTRKKQAAVAEHAATAEASLRREQAGIKRQIERAKADVAAASRRRLEAREKSTALLDAWSAECDRFWTERTDPDWVKDNLEIMETQGAEAAEIYAARDTAQTQADASAEALRTAQVELAGVEARKEANAARRVVLVKRTEAIQSGSVEVEETIVELREQTRKELAKLDESDASLTTREGELRGNIPDLERTRDTDRVAVATLDTSLHDVRQVLYDYTIAEDEQAHTRQLREGLSGDRERAEELQTESARLAGVETEAKAAVMRVIHARKGLQDAHTELNLLVLEEKQLEEDASLWRLTEERGQKIDAAKQALVDLRVRKAAAKTAFDQATAELNASEDDVGEASLANAVEATTARVNAEATQAEQDRHVAHVEVELAAEEARVATIVHDLAEQRLGQLLDEQAIDDPEFGAAREALSTVEQAADAAVSVLLKKEAAVRRLMTEVEDLVDDVEDAEGDPLELTARLEALDAARAEAKAALEASDTAASASQAARAEYDAKVVELGTTNEHVGKLLKTVETSDREASRAAEHEAASIDHLNRSDAALAEAHRAKNVAGEIANTGDFIGQNKDLIGSFHKLEDPTGEGTSSSVDLLSPERVHEVREAIGRESAGEEIGEFAKLKEFVEFQDQLELKAAAMISHGATAEELREAFARIPNGLRPASYRAEVEAFETLEAAFAELDKEEAEEAREQRILEAAKRLETPEEKSVRVADTFVAMGGKLEDLAKITDQIPNAMEMAGHQSTEGGAFETIAQGSATANPEIVGHLDNVFSSLGALAGIAGAAKGWVKYGQGESEGLDPVQKKLRQDELLDNLQGTFSAAMQGTKQFGAMDVAGNVPLLGVLGTIDRAKDLAMHACEAAARKGKERYDTLLEDAARVAGSPLASAFEESVAQERKLWAKYAVDATADAVMIAADILKAFPGPGQAIGVALHIASFTAETINSCVHACVDMSKASKCKKLLASARNGDDTAKVELFKNHGNYAKGLIAFMAFVEKDRFALLYVNKRGINEREVEQSSAKVIAHYLLVQARQDEPVDTWEEWADRWEGNLKTGGWVALSVVFLGIPLGIDALLNSEAAELDPEQVAKLEKLESLAGSLVDNQIGASDLIAQLSDKIRKAATRTEKAPLEGLKARLERLVGSYDEAFTDIRKGAVDGLKGLSDGKTALDTLSARPAESLSSAERKAINTAKKWLPKLRSSHVNIVRSLTAAA